MFAELRELQSSEAIRVIMNKNVFEKSGLCVLARR